ncbi:hypothetical protein AB0M80_37245 [Amycolatopsis sp. NPDC051045]|uniref:hypothetical protein n=1 Tax=Amycolatopsis sp. NPDC051045 TaxID=3156922 RepID=UPI00344AD311
MDEPSDHDHVVNAEVVDIAAGEAISLAHALAHHLHHDSPIGVHAGIGARPNSEERYVCADRDDIGRLAIRSTSRAPRPHPALDD